MLRLDGKLFLFLLLFIYLFVYLFIYLFIYLYRDILFSIKIDVHTSPATRFLFLRRSHWQTAFVTLTLAN